MRVLVYGGNGALGSKCVNFFKTHQHWVISVGHRENPEADINITLKKDDSAEDQELNVLNSVNNSLNQSKLDGLFCVAGGWVGGSAKKALVKNAVKTWDQSVVPSLISTSVAVQHLVENGLLVFCGASSALEPTPNMIAYGLSKSAVHHLTKSLGAENSGLPKGVTVVTILPGVLDTEINRKLLSKGDFSSWTTLDFIMELFSDWVEGRKRPLSGSLLKLVTQNNITNVVTL